MRQRSRFACLLALILVCGSALVGSQRANADPACFGMNFILNCDGYSDCELSSATWCAGPTAPGYLCAPNLVSFYSSFCSGMALYNGDCWLAMDYARNNGEICCVEDCEDCDENTNCSTP
jgi:hypothetical protein